MRGDVRMLDDPLRAQSLSLIAGVILAVIIVAVCAVLAFLRPPGTLGNAPIVMVRDSGALYVRIGDTVHPVMNLASARLIAGTPANPEAVNMSAISNTKSGPLVGIPGAPATIAPPLGEPESGWAVCDDATSTTVIAGDVLGEGLGSGHSVLVTPRSESAATTYLLHDGWRAEVDLRNRAVVRALKLDGVEPQPVSRALLDATPEAPPIHPPSIAGAGSPSPLRGYPVGSVVRVARAAAESTTSSSPRVCNGSPTRRRPHPVHRLTTRPRHRHRRARRHRGHARRRLVARLDVSAARRCIQRRRRVHTMASSARQTPKRLH